MEDDEPTDQQILEENVCLDHFPAEPEEELDQIVEAFQLLEDILCFETANMIDLD